MSQRKLRESPGVEPSPLSSWPEQRPPQALVQPEPTRRAPRAAAQKFLEESWLLKLETFECWTSAQPDFATREPVAHEIFTAMVILEQLARTPRRSPLKTFIPAMLARKRSGEGLHHFFVDESLLPADADCTAIAHSLLCRSRLIERQEALAVARKIFRNTDASGVIAVYFTEEPSRKDIIEPAVCANALHFLAQLGIREGTEPTEDLLFATLKSRSYEAGTRYYPSPDAFLYFLTRMVSEAPARFARFAVPLRRAVLERQNATRGPLDRAFRVIAGSLLQLPVEKERRALLALQQPNGAWPAEVFFRYGRSPRYFGSEAVTTAFALRALG